MVRLALSIITFSMIAASGVVNASPVSLQSPAGTAREINPQTVETFFDVAFETQRLDHELVGATVAVVKDGEIVFKKGYGFADLEQRTPVDPDKHLFRIASVSKPFTWTAVMQLVEQGKLDLEADIQTYLDFEVPKTYPEPIRLKHLLTHTPGFEDQGTAGFAKTSDEVMPLSEYLPAHMPARVRRPGTYVSYSNYGSAVAGYIVQRVSGMAWADYIQQNIIDPLQMTETNVHQPMSADHKAHHAKGYSYSGGQYKPTDFWFEHEAPAGVISTTANNMTTWMLMHLNEGSFNDISILKPETVIQMHSELFRQHPDGQPVLHGFYRSDRNGIEIFGHGGDVNQFHSNLSFVPKHNLGIFVSYNSDPGSRARSNVIAAFVNYFLPASYASVIEPNSDVVLDDYIGIWTSTRRNHSTFEKLALLMSQMTIYADNNELALTGQAGTTRWIPVEKDRFRAKYANSHLLFYRNEQGEVTHFSPEAGFGSFEKVPWYEARDLNGLAYFFVAFVSLVYLLRFVFRLVVVRNNEGAVSTVDQWLGAFSCIAMIFLIYRLAIGLTGNGDEFLYGVPDSVSLLFKLTLAFTLLGLVVVVLSVRQWLTSQGSLLARLHYGILALAILLFLYLNWFWNVLTHYF
jgi:CubicO group peptidase (beta-lactamase class C family)